MTNEQLILLIDKLIWPVFFIILYLFNLKTFRKFFEALVGRIKSGSEIKFGGFSIGEANINLPSAKANEEITENHLALLHSSWRYPKKDSEFGKKMYVIQVILQAQKDVLDRVEYVRYSLHPTYANRIQARTNRENNFELKELAWGEFNLRAEVKIREQEEPVTLTRYINLADTGENLLTHYAGASAKEK